MMPKYVAHMIPEYLGHTLNWIYTQIKHVNRYTPYVITRRTTNLDAYPLELVFTSRQTDRAPARMPWGERIIRRLGFLPLGDSRCFSAALRQLPPVFIHAHFGWDGFFALGLKKKHRLPLVTRFYGYDVGILPQIPLWQRRYHRLFAEGDLFIVEGTNMKGILTGMGCPEDKIAVHHLGVELGWLPYRPREPKPDRLCVLLAGTFKEKKGFEYALRALRGVHKGLHGRGLAITIIGDGVLKEGLHSLARDLGLYDAITWTGYRAHDFFVRSLYEADVFLSPSVTAANGDTEGGAPVAIIEAGASGLPVVSTTHADIPEVVLDGRTGLLAAERDVDSLVEAMSKLAAHPDLRIEFGRRARQHIEENYEAVRQGERLTEIYARLDKKA
jgi:colanic acid/amylovoran biosynthesis glycosyltransferase